jgi:hypothetical protein
VNTTITEKATQETRDFYPVVRPSNTCLLPRCGVPMDEGCTQPLSSDPMMRFLRPGSSGPTGLQRYVSDVVLDKDHLVPAYHFHSPEHGSVMSHHVDVGW